MIIFASELKHKPVLLKRESALVGVVEELIINPDNGDLDGILVREGFGKGNVKTLAAKDIVSITTDFFLINSYESLGEVDEIVRLKEILDRDIAIVKNKVYTVSGQYLGKVRDYSIDLKAMKMQRIYVEGTFLKALTREYIIVYPQIVAIEKDKITVEDATILDKKPVKAKLAQTT